MQRSKDGGGGWQLQPGSPAQGGGAVARCGHEAELHRAGVPPRGLERQPRGAVQDIVRKQGQKAVLMPYHVRNNSCVNVAWHMELKIKQRKRMAS